MPTSSSDGKHKFKKTTRTQKALCKFTNEPGDKHAFWNHLLWAKQSTRNNKNKRAAVTFIKLAPGLSLDRGNNNTADTTSNSNNTARGGVVSARQSKKRSAGTNDEDEQQRKKEAQLQHERDMVRAAYSGSVLEATFDNNFNHIVQGERQGNGTYVFTFGNDFDTATFDKDSATLQFQSGAVWFPVFTGGECSACGRHDSATDEDQSKSDSVGNDENEQEQTQVTSPSPSPSPSPTPTQKKYAQQQQQQQQQQNNKYADDGNDDSNRKQHKASIAARPHKLYSSRIYKHQITDKDFYKEIDEGTDVRFLSQVEHYKHQSKQYDAAPACCPDEVYVSLNGDGTNVSPTTNNNKNNGGGIRDLGTMSSSGRDSSSGVNDMHNQDGHNNKENNKNKHTPMITSVAQNSTVPPVKVNTSNSVPSLSTRPSNTADWNFSESAATIALVVICLLTLRAWLKRSHN